MATTPVDYNALAAQAGAVNSAPPPSKAKPVNASGAIDYNALARQAGAIDPPRPTQSAQASPEDQASQTRQMLVSGLTGMPTPNMTEQDRQEFEQGKAAGAISVPVVAGAVAAPGTARLLALHPGTGEHPVSRLRVWRGLMPVLHETREKAPQTRLKFTLPRAISEEVGRRMVDVRKNCECKGYGCKVCDDYSDVVRN